MKLTYWIAPIRGDSPAYNLRAKTRRECLTLIANNDPSVFDPPRKVTVEYWDGFDLMQQCLGEGHGIWESFS